MFVACIHMKTKVHKQTCGVTEICFIFCLIVAVKLCLKRSCASLEGMNPNEVQRADAQC